MLRLQLFQKPQAFDDLLEKQRSLRDQRIMGAIPDTLFLLQHEACVTRGRGLQTGQVRERGRFEERPLHLKLPYFETERGGDLTLHLPGQLVLYPIVDIRSFRLWGDGSLAGFLRGLEQSWIELLKPTWFLEQKAGASGLWLGERKVASLGISVRRFVTMHGLAINVTNSLEAFRSFRPCGFDGDVMTRLLDTHPVTVEEIQQRFLNWVRSQSSAVEFLVC
jgi:lipoyl(octanoyl) transferase